MRPRSAGCEPPGSTCASATDPNTFPRTPTPSCTRPRSRSGTSSWPRPANVGILVLHRAGVLRAIVATRGTIAVAGSHGKTTTSSMLALILREAGLEPELRHRWRAERGRRPTPRTATVEWLVVEADESDGTFLQLAPEAAIVTNVEPDHLDHYGGFAELVARVRAFRRRGPGSGRVRRRRRRRRVDRREPARGSARTATIPTPTTGSSTTAADRKDAASRSRHDGDRLGELVVPLGVKAATNAAGAAAMALELGVEFDAVAACAARLRWRRAPVPVPRRTRRRDVRRRLRAPARPRSPPRSRRRARRLADA